LCRVTLSLGNRAETANKPISSTRRCVCICMSSGTDAWIHDLPNHGHVGLLRIVLSVFFWFAFQSASSSKSLYSPTEQWMAVLQCTCRPTSPESNETSIIHLWRTDRVSSYNLTQPFLWITLPAHLTSAPSLTVFWQRLSEDFSLPARSYADSIIWHSEFTFCCGPSTNCVI